jgi:hypothetical protein
MLVLCDEHIRTTKRLYCPGTLCWMILRHSTFGGATHFQAMLGTNIVPGFAPVQTKLKRMIWHVLEYSIKPKWAPAPSTEQPSTGTLRLDDRLHPVDLRREVVYHTHYSSTGVGDPKAYCQMKSESLLAGRPGLKKAQATRSSCYLVFPCRLWIVA